MAFMHCLPRRIFVSRSFMMSAQQLAQKVLETIEENNPYYKKYANKIAKLQQTSPNEFLERIDKVDNPIKDKKIQNRTYSELLNPKKPLAKGEPEIPHKELNDIMKLELIADKSSIEISNIWLEYHKNKDVLAATLTLIQYDKLMETARKYPMFLLPLPRSEGFEFIIFQFAANAIHFTTLLAYQTHGENAPECLTLVHYTETRGKNIILMRGEYDSNVLSGQEAQCLTNQMQMFYCKNDENKVKLLETFTSRPDAFKHMDLIKEIENIQLF